MTKNQDVEFPGVKAIFKRLMGEAWQFPGKSRHVRLTNSTLADAIKGHPQYVSHFRNGHAAPSEEQSRAIADFLFGKTPSQRKLDFLAEMESAADQRTPQGTGNFLEDLADGFAKLEISSVDYPPFAGDRNCAFEAITDRFLDLCGISQMPLPKRARSARVNRFETLICIIY